MLLPHPGDGLLRGLVAGVDLGGVQKLRQRPLLVARIHQLLALGHMHGRSGNPHAVKGCAELQILGSLFAGLLVVVEGGVVVLLRLGGLAALEEGAGRLGAQRNAGQAEDRQDGKKRNPEKGS